MPEPAAREGLRCQNERMNNASAGSAARTVLFLGDSITDCGRVEDPDHLGYGYVRLVAEHLAAHEPSARVLNLGVGGERVRDLVARVGGDLLDRDPDVVTIYVGVNDSWHRDEQGSTTSEEDFERDYRFLLDQLSASRPATPVLLVVPFVTDVDESMASLHADLDGKVHVIRALAQEFGATVVDAEHVMREALEIGHTPTSLAADGVHPTIAGHRLLADAWIDAAPVPSRRIR